MRSPVKGRMCKLKTSDDYCRAWAICMTYVMQGFQEALKVHAEQLVDDPVVHTHLSALYDTLLEQNLIRLIEPFSCVQISHLAQLIKLPLETVLNKLAQVSFLAHFTLALSVLISRDVIKHVWCVDDVS